MRVDSDQCASLKMADLFFPMTARCAVCGGNKWQALANAPGGRWTRGKAGLLSRHDLSIALGVCKGCGHVLHCDAIDAASVASNYALAGKSPPAFDAISSRSANWFEHAVGHADEYLRQPDCRIVDVGAGGGQLLALLRDQYGVSPKNLAGIDYLPPPPPLRGAAVDINIASAHAAPVHDLAGWADLGFCLSVLEHVIDPAATLEWIGLHLVDEGLLFLEVPDCDRLPANQWIATIGLVHFHHIHYFTAQSICRLIAPDR